MSNLNKEQKKLYENFHQNTKSFNKLPKKTHFTYKHIIKLIEKHTHKNCRILDLGCGAGVISLYLSRKGYRVTGVDVSLKSINACNKTKNILEDNSVKFIQGDIFTKKLKRKYDLVIMSELIEHVNNDYSLMKKAKTLLSNKGKIIITTPSINAPLYKLGLLNKFDKRVGHIRRYSKESLIKLISDNNFRIISLTKNEGIIRNSLFNFNIFSIIVRAANKFALLGSIITIIDNISVIIFGESDLQLVAAKK